MWGDRIPAAEGHVEARFDLQEILRENAKLPRDSVAHEAHANAQMMLREFLQHRLDFWQLDCGLSLSQRVRKSTQIDP